MNSLFLDLRHSVRMLRKSPGFTTVAVLALALGIGANTAIFTVVNAALLRPLPFPDSDRLVHIRETYGRMRDGSASAPDFRDFQEQNRVFDYVAAYEGSSFTLLGRDASERVSGAFVSPDFVPMLGVTPLKGRWFASGEDRPGHASVAVISDSLWKRKFGADPNIAGKKLVVDGAPLTIVGVLQTLPPGFLTSDPVQVWQPLVFSKDAMEHRGSHYLRVLGKRKAGVTLEQAREQMNEVMSRIAREYPQSSAGRGIFLIPAAEQMTGNVRTALLVLLGAVGFVLLIACANVANLLLARAADRRKETAIRTALGASKWRLVRQFLVESVMLSGLGGFAGLLVAFWSIDALVALPAAPIPHSGDIAIDGVVLGFTMLLSLTAGIGFGLVPAIEASHAGPHDAIREGVRSVGSSRQNRLRGILVTTEIALALVLVAGAGLLIKSFARLERTPSGLQPEHVLTMRLAPSGKYATLDARASFYRRALESVRQIASVESAGMVTILPIQDFGMNGDFSIEGRPKFPPANAPLAEQRAASAGYFRTLGIPLIEGRYFEDRDTASAPPVAIINQTMAKRFWPDRSPIGSRIQVEEKKVQTIVGVIGDVKQSGLAAPVAMEIYTPVAQTGFAFLTQRMSLAVRSEGDPAALSAAIRRAIQNIDPAQPVYRVQTMEAAIEESLAANRFNTLLLSIFAGLALLLGMIGVYGVMSYTVRQRTREIGIRIALGARAADVFRLVLGESLALAGAGIVIGLAASLALSRVLSGLLFEVSPRDPAILAIVTASMALVAALAAYFPARRAMKVNPSVALRYE